MATTKKPTGLKITRNKNTFTFSWTNAEKYQDVDLHIKIGYKNSKGKSKSKKFKYKTGAKDLKGNKASITIPYKGYTPSRYISFQAQGKAKDKSESGYTKWKKYPIYAPTKPSISATVDLNVDNKTTFSASVPDADAGNNHWFRYYKYRHITQFEGGGKSEGKWTQGENYSASYSYATPESDISKAPFYRQVEIQAFGPGGSSAVASAYHVYSTPDLPANVRLATAAEDVTRNVTNIRAVWTERPSFWRPIDKTELHYCVSPPDRGMVAPKNLEGTVVSTLESKNIYNKDKKNYHFENGANITLNKLLQDNEVLFYQIWHYHDNKKNYTQWYRAETLGGRLSQPTVDDVRPSPGETQYYHIEATNTAGEAVPDSFLILTWKGVYADETEVEVLVGIIENGETEIDVAMPDDPYDLKDPTKPLSRIGFGVRAYAYARKYTPVTIKGGGTNEPSKATVFNFIKTELYKKVGENYISVGEESYNPSLTYYVYGDGLDVDWWGSAPEYKLYKIYTLPDTSGIFSMQSEYVWKGGEVPSPPLNFEVICDDKGVAEASWLWSWALATEIELSWSTYEDAWRSTEEPATYVVPKLNGKKWFIHGLNAGEVYFFKARFLSQTSAGPYTQMRTVNLTAAPLTPTLSFNGMQRIFVTEKQDVVASWTYTSGDTKPQDKAEIFLVTIDDNGTRYGRYRPAIELLAPNPEGDPPFIFDPNRTYYTLSEGVYTPVQDPVESEVENYYLFDGDTPFLQTAPGSTAQTLSFVAGDPKLGLEQGKEYYFAIKLTSQSSATSEFSPMACLTIVEPLEPPVVPTITEFQPEVVVDTTEDEEGQMIESRRVYLALKSLPFKLNVTGVGDQGTIIVTIQRTESFFTMKPDERTDTGYEGEIVALIRKEDGDGEIPVDQDDLMGYLDDEATYKLVVTIIDTNGQTATTEHFTANVDAESFETYKPILYTRLETGIREYAYILVEEDAVYDPTTTYYYKNEFTVSWTHQPVKPLAHIEVDQEHRGVKITPTVPPGVTPKEGDVVDIYRLSVDRPELIYENAQFGQTYVDPYPALGEFGGHRIVYRTKNGDYRTPLPEKEFSWVDSGLDGDEDYISGDVDYLDTRYAIINFEEGVVEFLYNIDLTSNWKKDFKETRYLGGHIQGDWNPGVSRTGTISTVSVTTQDQDMIKAMRRLADYAGIAHVRTRDGSSYPANVDISETLNHNPASYDEIASYSISVTRVDSQSLDGMTLEEWNRYIENLEGE